MDRQPDNKQEDFERRRAEMMRLMERHMDTDASTHRLADEACVSRGYFQRVFRRTMEETPAEMQRRLRLERAAHALQTTDVDVSTVAFDAGYGSVEGFSRAFRRAYGEPPSQFRGSGRSQVRLVAASRVHFDAQTLGLRTIPHLRGEKPMDLVDRMIDFDYRSKRELLQSALSLTDAQLDAPLFCQVKLVPWATPDKSLRETFSRMNELGWWTSELFDSIGWPHTTSPRPDEPSVQEMMDRLDTHYEAYAAFVQHVKENDMWESTWVDDACVPPQTFTYGGLIQESLERGIFRRQMARQLLNQLGLAVW